MILHFDTETTGLPVPGVPSDDPRHPHIVSLSAILDDDDGNQRRVMSVIVRPDGYRLEDFPEAQNVHGITTDIATKYGVPLMDALEQFGNMLLPETVMSAFNHHFDHKLLKIACARCEDKEYGNDLRRNLALMSAVCTMEAAATALNGKKRISLKNAHFELFKEEARGAHTSLGDTYSSRRIYYELKKRGAVMEPKSLAEKEYAMPYTPAA